MISTKKGFWATLSAVALIGALTCSSAHAIAYTPDTLLGAIDSANSGQAYEESWLESFIGGGANITLLSNVNTNTFLTDDNGSHYIDMAPSTPGYFILKFGTGNSGNDMFFFQNIAELTKLVWTDTQLTSAGLPANHLLSISHYAVTSSTSVPEPSTLMLFGLGLVGVGFFSRRRTAGLVSQYDA